MRRAFLDANGNVEEEAKVEDAVPAEHELLGQNQAPAAAPGNAAQPARPRKPKPLEIDTTQKKKKNRFSNKSREERKD